MNESCEYWKASDLSWESATNAIALQLGINPEGLSSEEWYEEVSDRLYPLMAVSLADQEARDIIYKAASLLSRESD